MTFYHVTDFALWEKKIRKQGLRVYDLGQNVQYWRDYAPDITEGIWLWPKMDEATMRDCFLFQRTSKWITKVAILACDCEETPLLSEVLEDRFPKAHHVNLTHHVWWEYRGVRRGHDNAPFDIALLDIPTKDITLYAQVEEVIRYEQAKRQA